MGKPKLLLHAGTHKTGTTSIQSFLQENRDWLAGQGVNYPMLHPQYRGRRTTQHRFFKLPAGRIGWENWRAARFQRRLMREAGRFDLTVLSSESLWRGRQASEGAAKLPWNAGRRAYLERVARQLAGFETRVLIYLRRPDAYVESLYKEGVVRRFMGVRETLAGFAGRRVGESGYAKQIEMFRAGFGAVDLLKFEDEAKGGLAAGFCRQMGLGIGDRVEPPASRPSPGNRAIRWLSEVERGQKRGFVRRIRFSLSSAGQAVFHDPERSMLWDSAGDLAAFVDLHAASYDLLGHERPDPGARPPVSWGSADQVVADAAFQDWERDNLDLLRERERRKLSFWMPDPV